MNQSNQNNCNSSVVAIVEGIQDSPGIPHIAQIGPDTRRTIAVIAEQIYWSRNPELAPDRADCPGLVEEWSNSGPDSLFPEIDDPILKGAVIHLLYGIINSMYSDFSKRERSKTGQLAGATKP